MKHTLREEGKAFNHALPYGKKAVEWTMETTEEGGIITQRLEETGGSPQKVAEWIINTREEGITQALINLGWTPPNQQQNQT